ncbi:MAG: extracellular solute-binding protein [Roseburia sp.]|nr:extracellular solute-binding protein [Roseburia sp.]
MTRKKNYIKICAMALALGMLSSLLSGCSQTRNTGRETDVDVNEETTTLWVLTEISNTDGMNYQAEQIAKAFEKEHEGITVKLEILPTDTEEREIYLKQLRTQIMAGEGPDVYLLPTGDTIETDIPGRGSQTRVTLEYEIDPLFRDVTQNMYNGVFADISRYYDADEELNTEGLQKEIMDAGVIDGCRYVLPIRYDIPSLFVDPELSEEAGITQTVLDEGISALTQNVLDKNDTMMAVGLKLPNDTLLLSQLFDYEKGEILVTEQEIADYMRLYQKWYAFSYGATSDFIEQTTETYWRSFEIPGVTLEQMPEMFPLEFNRESFLTHNTMIDSGMHWSNLGFSCYSGGLQDALDQAAAAWVLEKDIVSHPLRAMDGSVVAEVTYYGAVGAGTNQPELAYDFLREFLTEDYQWEILRPQTDRSKDDMWNHAREIQNDGLVEESWPVRSKEAASYLWKNWRYQIYFEYNSFLPVSMAMHKAFQHGEIAASVEENMDVLNYSIDEVRFPITQDYEETLEYALTLLNNEDGTPTAIDIDALAAEVYMNLWWHLAEG